MTFVPVDGCELFVTEVGTGPPALVMHGGLGLDHTYLTPGLDPLGRHRSLHYYDHRGNGRSGRPSINTLSLKQLADDANALTNSVGVDHISVIGHSYGGFVALEFAVTYPERIDKLVLLDTAPAGDYLGELPGNAKNMGATEEILRLLETVPETDDEFARWWFSVAPIYFVNFDADQFREVMRRTIYCAAAVKASGDRWAEWSAVDRLEHITASTLVLSGRQDWITPPEQAERMALGISKAELMIIEGAGHFPWLEDPNTLTVVNEFLAG